MGMFVSGIRIGVLGGIPQFYSSPGCDFYYCDIYSDVQDHRYRTGAPDNGNVLYNHMM